MPYYIMGTYEKLLGVFKRSNCVDDFIFKISVKVKCFNIIIMYRSILQSLYKQRLLLLFFMNSQRITPIHTNRIGV